MATNVATPPLTTEQVEVFWREGFVLVPEVVPSEDIDQLRTDLDRLTRNDGAVVWALPWIDSERGHGFAPVTNLAARSDRWREVLRGVLKHQATALLQEPVELYDATGITKPPQRGQTFPLHQDGIYYGPIDGRYVIANVYLDDVTPTNGSIHFVPRTHDRLRDHLVWPNKKRVLEPAEFPSVIEPPAKAGDVVWFHLFTVHGSRPNHGRTPRRTVRAGYVRVAA